MLMERGSATMGDLEQTGPPRSYRDLVIIDNPQVVLWDAFTVTVGSQSNPISAHYS